MEAFEKLRCELIDELEYINMKRKQIKSKRLTQLKDIEEEKRSGSAHSSEENIITGGGTKDCWNRRGYGGRYLGEEDNR